MEITVSDAGEVKVIRIEGKLDTQTSLNAQSQLTQLIDQGATKLAINFAKLDYISSAGLDVLLRAAKQLKANSGELRVCSLNEFVQEVFEVSGFSTILSVFNSESDALRRF